MIDLAVPTTRDLEALPDGSTLELTNVHCPNVSQVWTARPARVPFVRFWEHRLPTHDVVAATSSILAAQVMGLVIDHGDVALPVVTLPELAGLACSDCGCAYVRDQARTGWTCPGCRGYLTDTDVAHLRRGGGA